MKFRMLVAVAAMVLLALITGCAGNQAKPLPPAQVIAIACPPIQAAITQFVALDATLPTVPEAQKAGVALAQVQPVIAAACTAGATVDASTVQAFAQTVLPALGQVAGSLPLPPAQLAQVQAGLVAAEIAVGAAGVVEQQIRAAQAAPASAASSAKP